MIHEMKLKDSPFNMIKLGKKMVELRLYDEKRRRIDIEDQIIFTRSSDENERIAVTVKALYRFASFKALFEEVPLEQCGFSANATIGDAVDQMRNFYTEEKEKQYGVIGIRVVPTDLRSVLLEQERLKVAAYDRFFPDGMK